MENLKIIFFGSTSDSVLVLDKLQNYNITSVVTQPPKPVGRDQTVTPTPVEKYAKKNQIQVFYFNPDKQKPWLYEDEKLVIDTLLPLQANLVISASYGQKIPVEVISRAKYQGLNVHPSLLPRWRGADPVPWSIIAGDKFTGVSVTALSAEFDQGTIFAQKKVKITDSETSDQLRTRLFQLGSDLLYNLLTSNTTGHPMFQAIQPPGFTSLKPKEIHPYAYKFHRESGFIPWTIIQAAIKGVPYEDFVIKQFNDLLIPKKLLQQQIKLDTDFSGFIVRLIRALTPWPGLWTVIKLKSGDGNDLKRLKILDAHCKNGLLSINEVQLEGKNPVPFYQFKTAYPNITL